MLAVTHDHRTLPYADRIIRIEDGRIVSDERPDKCQAPPTAATPPTLYTPAENSGVAAIRIRRHA